MLTTLEQFGLSVKVGQASFSQRPLLSLVGVWLYGRAWVEGSSYVKHAISLSLLKALNCGHVRHGC